MNDEDLLDGMALVVEIRRLTCDMSGGPKGAKRPLGRPLDGGVRPRRLTGRGRHAVALPLGKNVGNQSIGMTVTQTVLRFK